VGGSIAGVVSRQKVGVKKKVGGVAVWLCGQCANRPLEGGLRRDEGSGISGSLGVTRSPDLRDDRALERWTGMRELCNQS